MTQNISMLFSNKIFAHLTKKSSTLFLLIIILFTNIQIVNSQTVSGIIREKCSNLPIPGYKLSFIRSPYNTLVTANGSGAYSFNLTGL